MNIWYVTGMLSIVRMFQTELKMDSGSNLFWIKPDSDFSVFQSL